MPRAFAQDLRYLKETMAQIEGLVELLSSNVEDAPDLVEATSLVRMRTSELWDILVKFKVRFW